MLGCSISVGTIKFINSAFIETENYEAHNLKGRCGRYLRLGRKLLLSDGAQEIAWEKARSEAEWWQVSNLGVNKVPKDSDVGKINYKGKEV